MKMKFKLPITFLGVNLIILIAMFIFIRLQTSQTVLAGLVERMKDVPEGGGVTMISELIRANLFGNILLFFLGLGLFSFIVMTIFFHKNITAPIQRLNERLKVISKFNKQPPLTFWAKDEIGELYQHVASMEERLYETHLQEVGMIGAIAHDLKTPLTAINGFLELMETQPDLEEEKKEEYLRLIRKKAELMTELVQEFSNFTALEVQLYEIELKELPIARILDSLGEEYEAELSGMGIEFQWSNRVGNCAIQGNELLLRRLFANIISNAVRYGPKNASLEELRIRMESRVSDSTLVIRIEDNGKGVPEESLERIFEKFYTLDPARQSKQGGVGLGLASCQSIMKRLGGDISAYGSAGGGLGIQMSFPAMEDR